MKKRIKQKTQNVIEDIKNSDVKKNKNNSQKILQKYKSMKRPKKMYLVNLNMIDYNEPQEYLFQGESIIEAANKVLDFEKF